MLERVGEVTFAALEHSVIHRDRDRRRVEAECEVGGELPRSKRGPFVQFTSRTHRSRMSVHVAEKKGSALKGSNGLIATVENEDGDWQNGQNLLLVTQDPQGKELINVTDNQNINVAVDTYCSYASRISLCFAKGDDFGGGGGRGQLVEPRSRSVVGECELNLNLRTQTHLTLI